MEHDNIDKQILEELQKDARQALKSLAKKIGISISALHARIKKLEDNGTIKKYTVLVDPEKVELDTTAFIFIECTVPTQRKVSTLLAKNPMCSEVFEVTGEKDVLVKVRAKQPRDVCEMILMKLGKQVGQIKSSTAIVYHTAKEDPTVQIT